MLGKLIRQKKKKEKIDREILKKSLIPRKKKKERQVFRVTSTLAFALERAMEMSTKFDVNYLFFKLKVYFLKLHIFFW